MINSGNFHLYTFRFQKRIPANPKNFCPYPPNISMTLFHTKKLITVIITLKKYTCKSENTLITLFHAKKIITFIITLKKYTYKSENTFIIPFYTNNNF